MWEQMPLLAVALELAAAQHTSAPLAERGSEALDSICLAPVSPSSLGRRAVGEDLRGIGERMDRDSLKRLFGLRRALLTSAATSGGGSRSNTEPAGDVGASSPPHRRSSVHADTLVTPSASRSNTDGSGNGSVLSSTVSPKPGRSEPLSFVELLENENWQRQLLVDMNHSRRARMQDAEREGRLRVQQGSEALRQRRRETEQIQRAAERTQFLGELAELRSALRVGSGTLE